MGQSLGRGWPRLARPVRVLWQDSGLRGRSIKRLVDTHNKRKERTMNTNGENGGVDSEQVLVQLFGDDGNDRIMYFFTAIKDGRRYVSLSDVIEYLRVTAKELEGTGRSATHALNQAVIDLWKINSNAEMGGTGVIHTQGRGDGEE